MQIDVEASQARGAGVNPEDPPLRWEVSQADGQWAPATVLEDLTGGFNYGSGTVELELPPRSVVAPLGGHRLHWLRCRIAETSVTGRSGATYSHAPEIYSITAAPMGARLPSTHAARVEREILGVSRRHARPELPAAPPAGAQARHRARRSRSRTRSPATGRAGSARPDFVGSTEFDRHFVLDLVSGEVELGPAIRETHGGWTQYGAVPPKGAVLRFTRYRHGGGREGNVTANTLTVLKSTIAGIDTVTNPDAAVGGVDAEIITHARQRASMEIRSRYRAVTAEDFEFMAGEASPRVARAVCIPPRDGGAVPLHLVPRIYPADRRLDFAELMPEEDLLTEVAEYLDERRLIGTTVELKPCRYRGLSRRRQPAGAPAGRHRARRGGRRARALHVPEPARRRQPDRPGRRAGRSGARSTRASSTASSMPSTASSSCASCACTRPTSRPASSRPSRPARTSCSSPTS